LRAWLFQVVTHLAYNSTRGQGRRQRREDAAFRMPSSEADPADLAEQVERRQSVRRSLLKLPERQAQLLLLRHAGLSYKELADVLQLAPGSVGTLLARAEAAFEKAYAAEEER
jgi:RNA polymerase sigma-70 factor (ECF subfamily)